METRLSPPAKERSPRSWGARLCSKVTAHLATAGPERLQGHRRGSWATDGDRGPQRPGRDGRGRRGKRKRGPSVSPGRGNSRRPAPRRRSAGDVREPSQECPPAAGAGTRPGLRTPGLEAGKGGASILGQGPGVGDVGASRCPLASPRARGMGNRNPGRGPSPRPPPKPLPIAGVDPRRLASVVVDVEDAAVVVARLLPAGGQRQLRALPGPRRHGGHGRHRDHGAGHGLQRLPRGLHGRRRFSRDLARLSPSPPAAAAQPRHDGTGPAAARPPRARRLLSQH